MSEKYKKQVCEMEVTLSKIGGKWKPLILWFLGNIGMLRFGQMRKLMPKITPKILTHQLRELEEDGLIHRKVYAQVPPKVEYSMTSKGKTLLPILKMMCKWAKQYENMDDTLINPLCKNGKKKKEYYLDKIRESDI